jgi:signal transduction histidine kinase
LDTAEPALATASWTAERRAALGGLVIVAALLCGGGAAALVLASDHYEDQILWAAFLPLLGWSFIGTGLFAWLRRPESRVGPLMMLVGFAWFLKALRASDSSLLFTVGFPLGSFYAAAFIHLLLSFPSGRLGSLPRRVVVSSGYGFLGLVTVPLLLVSEDGDSRLGCTHDCPRNLFLIQQDDAFADFYVAIVGVLGVGLLIAVCALTVLRWRRASPPERRILTPVFATGGLAAACFAAGAATESTALRWMGWGCLVVLPFGFLAGVLRARLARSAVADLIIELRGHPSPAELRDALAHALRDPGLTLAFWFAEHETYVDLDGRRTHLPEDGRRAITPIDRDGQRVAALVHDASLLDEPALLEAVGAAAGIALENARLQAELRARLLELKDSRARVIEATDSERRRLERDLHDCAQQRLVAISMELGRLEVWARSDPEMKQAIERTKREAEESLRELRELARGIHPALVTDHGLIVALEALVARSPIPVTLDVDLDGRLPSTVEVAAYYVVSECLTNVAKYAHASNTNIAVHRRNGHVVVEVSDDGVGGASADHGSGLRGLADRVGALDGRLRVWSPGGAGTRVRAEIPCAS